MRVEVNGGIEAGSTLNGTTIFGGIQEFCCRGSTFDSREMGSTE